MKINWYVVFFATLLSIVIRGACYFCGVAIGFWPVVFIGAGSYFFAYYCLHTEMPK